MNILWGLVGIITVIGLGYMLSVDRKSINLRTVLGALAIQITFAFITLKLPVGRDILLSTSNMFQGVIEYANDGISFLFGPLVGNENSHVFAFEVLTIIIFFSSLISILYYLGIMQRIVQVIGGGLSKALQTTKAESLSAAANIFLGLTEAPLTIKPYMATLHSSELFAVLVGGFGSVSGAVLVGYSLLGIPLEYLLAASFMAAPSSLLMAKVVYPLPKGELEAINQAQDHLIVADEENKPVNIIDAAAQGASTGLHMAIEMAGVLLAFVALIALVNGMLGFTGGLVGFPGLTMERIMGVLLAPISFLIGVPWEDAMVAGEFIGQKIVVNEFVAFANLGEIINDLTPKTGMILSFALAGFGNLGGIAAQIGGLGALVPERKNEISQLGLKSMITGALASLLNAAVAGIFF